MARKKSQNSCEILDVTCKQAAALDLFIFIGDSNSK